MDEWVLMRNTGALPVMGDPCAIHDYWTSFGVPRPVNRKDRNLMSTLRKHGGEPEPISEDQAVAYIREIRSISPNTHDPYWDALLGKRAEAPCN